MKYIDSEKLIAGLQHLQDKFPVATYDAIYYLITSLQQEQPPLPSNLDEAAEEYTNDSLNNLGAILRVNVSNAFKAGAEWMAGQGVSWEDKMTYYDGFLIYGQDERAYTMEGNFNEGDEVVVQIRKK